MRIILDYLRNKSLSLSGCIFPGKSPDLCWCDILSAYKQNGGNYFTPTGFLLYNKNMIHNFSLLTTGF